jgi:hypothetical protein
MPASRPVQTMFGALSPRKTALFGAESRGFKRQIE